jgi:transcriptional regulator with XRE-family HTH domain
MIPTTEEEHNKRVGQAIFYYRVNYKNPNRKNPPIMTQSKLASRVGVTFQQIQKYEKGSNAVSSYRIFQIAEALKISISDIFIKAYPDHNAVIGYFKPLETIAEINIEDQKPLVLKKDWNIDEKKQD